MNRLEFKTLLVSLSSSSFRLLLLLQSWFPSFPLASHSSWAWNGSSTSQLFNGELSKLRSASCPWFGNKSESICCYGDCRLCPSPPSTVLCRLHERRIESEKVIRWSTKFNEVLFCTAVLSASKEASITKETFLFFIFNLSFLRSLCRSVSPSIFILLQRHCNEKSSAVSTSLNT